MDDKRKDKIIIGLIIVIVALIANNFINNGQKDTLNSNISLFDSKEDLEIENLDSISDDENKEMKVHISGEIKNEGVYNINENDRLEDLIKKAGGLTENANSKDLNLAMKLEDEMKIYIPSLYEVDNEDESENLSIVSTNNESNSNKININKASKEELMSLPNIGEKRADSIIEYRQTNKFESIEDIKKVNGIGEKFYESLKDLITV